MDEIDRLARSAASTPPAPGEGLLVVGIPKVQSVPASSGSSGLLRYMGVPIMSEDYFPLTDGAPPEEQRQRNVELLASNNDRETMLIVLAELASSIAQPLLLAELLEAFREFLGELGAQHLARFDVAMTTNNGKRVFLGRQQVLATIRAVLARPEPVSPHAKIPPRMAMVMLAHVLSAIDNAATRRESGPMLSGFPQTLALDMVRNQAFHDEDDVYSALDRQLRLWQVYGPRFSDRLGQRTPAALLEAAIGIPVEDVFALGFALYAHFMQWRPDTPVRLVDDFNSDMASTVKEAFLRVIATSVEDMAAQCVVPATSAWDFLFLQKQPVVRGKGSLMVLDGRFLFDRFTSGIFWIVHDHLKASEGEMARQV